MGVLINTVSVLIFSSLGMYLGDNINKLVKEITIKVLGLAILVKGIQTLLSAQNYKNPIIYMIIAYLIGTTYKFDDKLTKLVNLLEKKLSNRTGNKFAKGFIISITFTCVGAMAILGSFNEALYNDRSVVYTKTILDSIITFIMTAIYGIGVVFSSAFIFLYQGFFFLFALKIKPYLTVVAIRDISIVGSMFLILLSINMIFDKKIKVFNAILAVFLPIFIEVIKL